MTDHRPKIGLALSGGSGRAIAHIGVLEVLREYNIPIDVITACSSGTIVAGSFACGTVEILKKDWFSWDKQFVWDLLQIDKSGRGLFSLEKVALFLSKYFQNDKFEDVFPRLGFVSVDVLTGEPVILALGDLVKAGVASCAVPGLFEPVEWGNRLLVDGGLYSIVPAQEARSMGADIVIGVDIAATRQILKKRYQRVWKGFKIVNDSTAWRFLKYAFSIVDTLYEKTMKVVFYNQSDFLEPDLAKEIDLFSVLSKSMDLISQRQKSVQVFASDCDVVLTPNVRHLGKMDFDSARKIYLEGRRAALEAIPQIEKSVKVWRKLKRGGELSLQNARTS